MAIAISNRDVIKASFEAVEFEGVWKELIGTPELRGSWLIYGNSGCGKTTFALQLAKYLSNFRKVAYNPLEQGLSLSFQNSWNCVGMGDVGSRISVLDKEDMDDLRLRLAKRKSPEVVIIDSLTCLPGFGKKEYVSLVRSFPTKLFIFVAHERRGEPDPAIAITVRRLSEVKMFVEGYKVTATSRFREGGEGEYVIWEEGAERYWVNKLQN